MMLNSITYFLGIILICAVTAEEDTVESNKPVYHPPSQPANGYFVETFDSKDDLNTWTHSNAKKDGADEDIAKYNGKWVIESQMENALDGDMGLVLKEKAKHYAISKKLITPFTFDKPQLVVQYEVNFQTGIECGGGYVKLLSESSDFDSDNFNDKTPYTIMFGPDKCGEDFKLHFIFRHKNPITGEFEEKHAKKTTADLKLPYGNKASHLYTLVINDDNSFVIYLDQKEINRGNLLEDMTPAVNPPKQIEDKDDRKPEDWDEREKIPDPDDFKPEEWDEDAPAKIEDPNAEMPEGWLEDEPLYVDDPDAEQPDDWDDDMDGEWEPPKIENPKCSEGPGCGLWEPPMIANPDFKGKWSPKLISNPAYKGIWKPRMIDNPDYFEDLTPYRMTPIGAVGLELWSMSSDIIFDNLLITSDKSEADEFAEATWQLKRTVHANSEAGFFQGLIDATNDRPWLWAIYILVVGLPVILIFTFCCSGGKKSDPKKTDEQQPDDEPQEEEKSEEDKTSDEVASGDASGEGSKTTSKSALEDDEESEKEEEESVPLRTSPRKRKTRVAE